MPGEILDPCADPRWRALIEAAGSATVFHTPAWLSLLRRQYGYRIDALCLLDDEARPRAGMPMALVASRLTGKRLVALPFSDLCPPVSDADAEDDELAIALDQFASRRALRLEVRSEISHVGQPAGAYYHHVVSLDGDVNTVRRRFTHGQALQGARRAQRMGVQVEQRTDRDALAAFYRLHVATRRRQGLPAHPRSFILGFEHLFDEGLGFVLLATLSGQAIAGAVYLKHRGVQTYKYGASDSRFLDRRPNNLLFAESITLGCEQGMETLDLGRTDLGHASLRSFKLMWGAEERVLRYTSLGAAVRGGGTPTRAPKTLQLLIRHSPELVSRALGEWLYKHAA